MPSVSEQAHFSLDKLARYCLNPGQLTDAQLTENSFPDSLNPRFIKRHVLARHSYVDQLRRIDGLTDA
jgi:hypothetical protein